MFNFTFDGNLAADAELSFTKTGQAVCHLRVIHNRRRRNESGEWVDDTPMAVAVTAWGQLAENCSSLKKGNTVLVEARDALSVWVYTRKDDQTPGGALQVVANNVGLSARFTEVEVVAREAAPAGDWNPTTDQARELEPSF